MSTIPDLQERLTEIDAKLESLTKEKSDLHHTRTNVVKLIKEKCPHPEEFYKERISYGDDPLAVDMHYVYCTICGELLESFYMNGSQKIVKGGIFSC